MKEMKTLKTGKGPMDELPYFVDWGEGEQDIANKFKEVYETVYNSASSDDEMKALKEKIQGIISSDDSE